jgi:hypothetical protein
MAVPAMDGTMAASYLTMRGQKWIISHDRRTHRDNDMDLEVDELGRDLGVALAASLCPAKLDRDGAAVNPTELAQPLHEGVGPLPHGRSSGPAQEPDRR